MRATTRKRPTSRAAQMRGARRAGKRRPSTQTKAVPLDEFIERGVRALNIRIERAWLPAISVNLEVTLRHGLLVEDFDLSDDIDPAPVFKP